LIDVRLGVAEEDVEVSDGGDVVVEDTRVDRRWVLLQEDRS
jgi:hypothetical protein